MPLSNVSLATTAFLGLRGYAAFECNVLLSLLRPMLPTRVSKLRFLTDGLLITYRALLCTDRIALLY